MKKLWAVLAILSIYLGGCAFSSVSHGTEIAEKELGEIKPGVTTKKDIYRTFGEPSKSLEGGSLLFFHGLEAGRPHFWEWDLLTLRLKVL